MTLSGRNTLRVHIIGLPSAGKTTLARSIADILGAPCHDLDSIAFVDDRWTLRPAPERDAMVDRILEEPSGVTEGGFLGWVEPFFAAADYIIWLDPPLTVLMWRHLVRHGRHPRWLPTLLLFQARMYLRPTGAGPAPDDPDQTRHGIERALRPWISKAYRVSTPVSGEDVVRRLSL